MTVSTKIKPEGRYRHLPNGDFFLEIHNLYCQVSRYENAPFTYYAKFDREWTTMRFIVIEVQLDSDDEEAHETMIEAARDAAKLLRAQAGMLSGRNGPQVKLKTWPMYDEPKELPLDLLQE